VVAIQEEEEPCQEEQQDHADDDADCDVAGLRGVHVSFCGSEGVLVGGGEGAVGQGGIFSLCVVGVLVGGGEEEGPL